MEMNNEIEKASAGLEYSPTEAFFIFAICKRNFVVGVLKW